MSGFGVLLGTNLLGLAVVIVRGDIVWCVAATWIAVSIWTANPKPAPIYVSDQAKMSVQKKKNSTDNKITSILFTVLLPLGLLVTFIYSQIYGRGRVRLQPGNEHPGLYGHDTEQPQGIERGPAEVNENSW